MANYEEFSIWIGNYRVAQGLSKEAMAEQCGISERYYSEIENIENKEVINPSFNVMRNFRRATGLSLDELADHMNEEEKKKNG